MFGKTWDKVATPVQAIVGDIDYTDRGITIGLSARQLENLDLTAESPIEVGEMVARNVRGLSDNSNYGWLLVASQDTPYCAIVYNAFGELAQGENRVRISYGLRDLLHVSIGDSITIEK